MCGDRFIRNSRSYGSQTMCRTTFKYVEQLWSLMVCLKVLETGCLVVAAKLNLMHTKFFTFDAVLKRNT